MPTARQHMLADMTHLFAQDGEEVVDVVIDDASHRAIVQELDGIAGTLDGTVIRRRALWLEKGKIILPKPGYDMLVDGELWNVESVDPTGILDVVTLSMTL